MKSKIKFLAGACAAALGMASMEAVADCQSNQDLYYFAVAASVFSVTNATASVNGSVVTPVYVYGFGQNHTYYPVCLTRGKLNYMAVSFTSKEGGQGMGTANCSAGKTCKALIPLQVTTQGHYYVNVSAYGGDIYSGSSVNCLQQVDTGDVPYAVCRRGS